MYRTNGSTVFGDAEADAQAEVVRVATVTASLFDVLQARASHGRLIEPDDDVPGGPLRVVLGYEFWRRRFGSEANVVGKILSAAGGDYEVIGVTEPGLSLPMPGPF